MKLKPRELEILRRRQLHTQRTALNAQQAQLDLDKYVLELEVKYHMIAHKANLDMTTGEFTIATDKK